MIDNIVHFLHTEPVLIIALELSKIAQTAVMFTQVAQQLIIAFVVFLVRHVSFYTRHVHQTNMVQE